MIDVIYFKSCTTHSNLKNAPLNSNDLFIIKFTNGGKKLLASLENEVSNQWKLINVRKKPLTLDLFFKCHLKSGENRNICF